MTFPLDTLTPAQFLKSYWQKKPLLIRQAFPTKIETLITPKLLFKLAAQEETRARLIIRKKNQWELHNGPFKPNDLKSLPASHWTLLVQGVNLASEAGDELLRHFNFIPSARLDDLMISYAAPLGGVGPHFDSYDVFLLQGLGKRKWQISKQKELILTPNLPLKILKSFKPEHEWILNSGDMLYLPPQIAHNGIAVDECMTYSIGFRAPSNQELFSEFLSYLQENLNFQGIYKDPLLKLQKNPAEISTQMIQQIATTLSKVKWKQNDVADFLGRYLTEPQPHLFFTPPRKPVGKSGFLKAAKKSGIKLDLKTQMLFNKNIIFVNGESYLPNQKAFSILTLLANNKYLPAKIMLSKEAGDLLYQWYLNGYICITDQS